MTNLSKHKLRKPVINLRRKGSKFSPTTKENILSSKRDISSLTRGL